MAEIHTGFWWGILYEGRRPLAKHELRWENSINRDVKERGWEDVNWAEQRGDLL